MTSTSSMDAITALTTFIVKADFFRSQRRALEAETRSQARCPFESEEPQTWVGCRAT